MAQKRAIDGANFSWRSQTMRTVCSGDSWPSSLNLALDITVYAPANSINPLKLEEVTTARLLISSK